METMQVAKSIIEIAALIAAITSIVTAIWKIYKLASKISKRVEEFEKGLKTNTLSTLRLVIINDDMPLQERINAGEEYVKLGGNGAIHAMYDQLVENYKKEVN